MYRVPVYSPHMAQHEYRSYINKHLLDRLSSKSSSDQKIKSYGSLVEHFVNPSQVLKQINYDVAEANQPCQCNQWQLDPRVYLSLYHCKSHLNCDSCLKD